MERIVTYVSNRLDGLERVARSTPDVFAPPPSDHDSAWGLAYRQGDEILVKKRPIAAGQALEIDDLVRNVQTDRATLHVGQPAPHGFSREDVGPHRFEHFTFTCITDAGVAPMPEVAPAFDHLAHGHASLRLFARLLTILERESAMLETPPAVVRAAFRDVHALLGGRFAAVLGNGRRSFAYVRDVDLAFAHREEPVGSPRAGEPPFRAVILVMGDAHAVPDDFRRAPARDSFGVIERGGALELGEA